jgi:Bacteriophage Lambda NinG protein
MPTRFSEKNCRPQCKTCNEDKRGNLAVFSERLEAEEPGIVAILEEQSRGIQGYDRDELKALIVDTTRRVKLLSNRIYH